MSPLPVPLTLAMHRQFITLLLIPWLFTACSFIDKFPGLYHLDIHQGNIVSQEMVDQLKPGMNKRQVTYIMGTPLLVGPFHDQRWDYIYANQPGGEERVQRRISLIFENDELVTLQGDFKPGDLPSIEAPRDVTVDIPHIERDTSWWGRLVKWFNS